MVQVGRRHVWAQYVPKTIGADPLGASPIFAKPLDELDSTPHVESTGPTVGPNGLEVPFELPPCVLPNGHPGIIGEFLDYKNVEVIYGGALLGYADASYNGISDYEEPTVGTHQLSFACYEEESPSPEAIAVFFGEIEWSRPAIWKDNGFTIETTGPDQPVSLSSHNAGPGYVVSTTSGAPAGPTPCPTVPGGPWQEVDVQLDVASFAINVPSKFVYEERFPLVGSSASSFPIPIPETQEVNSVLLVTVECKRLTSGPGNIDARFIYDYGEPYDQSLIRLTDPVGGALRSWETWGGSNPAEAACLCSEGWSGDPVNTATGEYSETDTDALVKGKRPPLSATRAYDSQRSGIMGPLGYGWSSSYTAHLEASGAEVTITEESGAEVRYEEREGHYVAPPRVTATLTRNSEGLYVFTTREPGHHLTYAFNAAGELQSIEEPDGNAVTITRPSASQMLVTGASGRALTYMLSGGLVRSVTDPVGDTTTFQYDSEGNLTKVTDPLGRSTSYTYDSAHHLLTRKDPRGAMTENTYNAAGQVVKQTDPLGRSTSYDYESEPGVTLVTSPSGTVTRYAYEFGFMTSRTLAYGTDEEARWNYSYDPLTGGEISVDGPDGSLNRTLNAEGAPLTSYDSEGNETQYTYNQLGEVTSQTDPLGTTTSYEYNAAGELTLKSTPLGAGEPTVTSSWTYGSGGEAGEMLTSTDPDGHLTGYGYDSAGDLASVTDPTGAETTMTYDADGRMRTRTVPDGNIPGGDPAAHTTTYEYDADAELTSLTGPLGAVTRYSYNEDGRQTHVQDPTGRTTSYGYDLDGEQTSTKQGEAPASTTSYNEDGQVSAQTDPAGKTTSYEYDLRGDRTAVTVNGVTTTTRYEGDGRPSEVLLPSGQTTSYYYDSDGQLRSIYYSDTDTPEVENTYDADGRRVSQRTGNSVSHFSYDALGRLTSETDGEGRQSSYTYDSDGNITTITYPNGKAITRTYDADGHLIEIEDWLGHKTNFTYDPDGNNEQESLPGGVTSTSAYDPEDRLTEIVDANSKGSLATFNYSRDEAGRFTSSSTSGALDTSTAYIYDRQGRLESEGETSFSYDQANNPIGYIDGSEQQFNAADQLTSSTAPRVPIIEPPEEHEPPTETHEEEHKTPGETGKGPLKTETPTGGLQIGETGSGIGYTPTSTTNPSEEGSIGVLGERSAAPAVLAERSAHTTNRHGTLSVHVPALEPHELLLALLSTPAARHAKPRISGLGLAWETVAGRRAQGGSVQITTARAGRAIPGGQVTVAGLSPRAPVLLRVIELNADAQVQTVGDASARSGAPAVHVSVRDGEKVWAIGHDTQRATPHATSGTLVAQLGTHNGTSWMERATSARTGTLTITDNQPSDGAWVLAAVTVAETATSASIERASASTDIPAPVARASVAGPSNRAPVRETAMRVLSAATEATTPPRRTFGYDSEGERTSETVEGHEAKLAYNQAGQLTAVGRLASYSYDGDGLRTSKTVDGDTTQFTWEHAEALPMMLQAGATSYIYGPTGAPVEQITDETPTYLLTDEQGSTRLLTDNEGAIVGSYSYGAWGNTSSHTGTSTQLQYDGQYTDEETGYLYLRGRYYDPSTGQFLTADPAYATTLARYDYAEDDPVNAQDPSGLFCILGHDPNGACRGSNLGNDVHAIGTTATVTGIVAGVVIVSVGTGGVADEIAADAAVVGLAADGVGAYDECASAPDPWSRQCAAGLGQVALDYATFGFGGGLTGAAAGAFDVASGLASYGYSQWTGSRSIVSTQSASASYCRGGSVPVYGPSGEMSGLSSYGSYLDP